MQDNAIHGAATDDIVRAQELGDVLEYPVEANTLIYQGSPVIVDGTGTASSASTPEAAIAIAGAGFFAGFALKRRDNRIGAVDFVGDSPGSGAAGAKRIRLQSRGRMVLWVLGSVHLDADVYATNSNEFTVNAPAAGAGYFVGRVAELQPDSPTGGLTRCTVAYDALAMFITSSAVQHVVTDPADTINTAMTADGAIAPRQGVVPLGGAAALAVSLADPATPADNGKFLRLVSTVAKAHVITVTGGLSGGASNTVTLGGAIGDMLVLEAVSGKWVMQPSINATASHV